MSASSKRIILALCSKPVPAGLTDISQALTAPPCGYEVAPPPLPDVLAPKLAHLIRTKYPGFEVIHGSTMEDFLNFKEKLQQVECVFQIDGPASVLKALIPLCPNLRWFHNYLAGVDVLCGVLNATPSVKNHQVSVGAAPDTLITNSKGVFSSSLKEYTLGVILHFCKEIDGLQKNQKGKIWKRFIMQELKGQTLGLIGYGDIAKQIAEAGKFLGMRCIACRRDPLKTDKILDAVYGPNEKLKVYAESDYVVCTLPGTAETRNSVSTAEFSAMKPSGIFISIGRGCVVDEAAIVDALKSKKIRGAAMDVFQVEPLATTSPLWDIENLIISSHNADYYVDYSAKSVLEVFEQNLEKYLAGAKTNKEMVTPVNPVLGY